MEVCPVQVEADVSSGLPCFTMVGFPSTQVKEAQDRVRTALKNNGISLPPKKVTVNLAPADLRKEGAGFDLPVAAAVLAASGFIEPQLLRNVMVVGELSLNGEVRSVSGVLPRVIRARELGCRYCIIPFENLAEGALVKDMKVVGVQNIKEVLKLVSDPDAFGKENQFSEVNSEENQVFQSRTHFINGLFNTRSINCKFGIQSFISLSTISFPEGCDRHAEEFGIFDILECNRVSILQITVPDGFSQAVSINNFRQHLLINIRSTCVVVASHNGCSLGKHIDGVSKTGLIRSFLTNLFLKVSTKEVMSFIYVHTKLW